MHELAGFQFRHRGIQLRPGHMVRTIKHRYRADGESEHHLDQRVPAAKPNAAMSIVSRNEISAARRPDLRSLVAS